VNAPRTAKRLLSPYGGSRGHLLLCFSAEVVDLPEDDPSLAMHSIRWEGRALARLLLEFGFDIDVLDIHKGEIPNDHPPYRAIVFHHNDLYRHRSRLGPDTVKIALMTGSNPDFQIRQEERRIVAMQQRRPGPYAPKRRVPFVDQELFSYRLADHCLLVGNGTTLSTYPDNLRDKITLADVSLTWPLYVKPRPDLAPREREFLWLGGIGAVLKGLDLVLEVLGRNPQWILNVVGPARDEPDFAALYRRELFECPNIRVHGWQQLASASMKEIASRSFAFVAPSASEGMSGSAAACLAMGLYPILSKECGIDLPEGLGTVLETCSLEEIEGAMSHAIAMDDVELVRRISVMQADALHRFSRESFVDSRRRILGRWLGVA
jgi:hypothetical protein